MLQLLNSQVNRGRCKCSSGCFSFRCNNITIRFWLLVDPTKRVAARCGWSPVVLRSAWQSGPCFWMQLFGARMFRSAEHSEQCGKSVRKKKWWFSKGSSLYFREIWVELNPTMKGRRTSGCRVRTLKKKPAARTSLKRPSTSQRQRFVCWQCFGHHKRLRVQKSGKVVWCRKHAWCYRCGRRHPAHHGHTTKEGSLRCTRKGLPRPGHWLGWAAEPLASWPDGWKPSGTCRTEGCSAKAWTKQHRGAEHFPLLLLQVLQQLLGRVHREELGTRTALLFQALLVPVMKNSTGAGDCCARGSSLLAASVLGLLLLHALWLSWCLPARIRARLTTQSTIDIWCLQHLKDKKSLDVQIPVENSHQDEIL